jgi:hypothetical protein
MTHSHLRRIAPAPMTDEAREAEIARLTQEMEAAYAIWQSDGCFAARGDADRLMRERDDLVRGRSAAQVAQMEAERGLV